MLYIVRIEVLFHRKYNKGFVPLVYRPPDNYEYRDVVVQCIYFWTLRALGCANCSNCNVSDIAYEVETIPVVYGRTVQGWRMKFILDTPATLRTDKYYDYEIDTGPGDLGILDAFAYVELV
jgi:hypothetical protein